MTKAEWLAYLARLDGLCEAAIAGRPTPEAARAALIAALAETTCPLNQPAVTVTAEAARVEVGKRAEMAKILDPASQPYRSAVNGLRLYFEWARDHVEPPTREPLSDEPARRDR